MCSGVLSKEFYALLPLSEAQKRLWASLLHPDVDVALYMYCQSTASPRDALAQHREDADHLPPSSTRGAFICFCWPHEPHLQEQSSVFMSVPKVHLQNKGPSKGPLQASSAWRTSQICAVKDDVQPRLGKPRFVTQRL